MNIYGKSFTFDGASSSDYGVKICSFDTPDDIRENASEQTLLKGDTHPYRDIPNYYTSKYSDVLKFDISLIKCDESAFTIDERKEIIVWLTSPLAPVLFSIEDNEIGGYHTDIEYFAKCTQYTEFIPNGNIHGLTFSFECNAPYGFSKEEAAPFTATPALPAKITINNTSDERYKDYYPVIDLQANATGKIAICNTLYPNEIMELAVKNGQKLHIDNQLGLISDSLEMFDYAKDTNLKWLRLAYGANPLTITGNAAGTIKCRYIRKVGI